MIAPNHVKEDEPLLIAPLRNKGITSELVGHHFATIINGITLTVKYEKQWCGRIATRTLHALVVHWFEKELSDINLDLFGKSSNYSVNTREKTSDILPILNLADGVHGKIE